MNVKTGKDAILETIGDLDELLMQMREAYASIEGMEIPEDEVENFCSMKRKIVQMMILRKRLAKYLLDTYGIFVMNGWES